MTTPTWQKVLPAGCLALLCLLLLQCRPAGRNGTVPPKPPARAALRQFLAGRYDSAIRNWNAAFAGFRAEGRWDSIYGYEEKYIIAHSRLYRVAEGNAFLDAVSAHLTAQQPVDSIELSKLWVRRSEMLYTDAKPLLARDTLEAVLRLRQRRLRYPHPLLADAYDYLQIATAQAGDLWTAADYGEAGIRTYKACLAAGWGRRDCSNLPWVIGNAGETYAALGYYDRAIGLLREAYDRLCADRAPIDSRLYYQIQLGGSYRRKGDFRSAIAMFQKAIDSLRSTDNRAFEAEADRGLALSYKETGLREQMLLYAGRQYALSGSLYKTGNHVEMAASAALLADCRLSADEPAAAGPPLREALAIYRATGDSLSLDYLEARSLEGRLHAKRGFADSARAAFGEVVEKRTALLGDTNDLVAVALLEAARAEDAAGKFAASSRAAGRALRIFSRTRNAGHPYALDCRWLLARARWKGDGDRSGALRLIGQGSEPAYGGTGRSRLQLLELAVQVLLPERGSTDLAAWRASLDSYTRLAAAYNQFLRFSVFEGAHFAEGGSTIRAIREGFLPAFRLYQLTGEERYLQAALDFSEQSRTGSIRLELQHYEANRFAGVPDSIVGREEALRIACASYEKLLLDAAGVRAPAARISQWTDSLLANRQAYALLLGDIAARYPAYYRLKLADTTISIPALKALAAGSRAALVEYLVAGGQLYAFVCTSHRCELRQLPVGSYQLEVLTAAYRDAMARADAAAYADAAWRLYAAAVAPLHDLLEGQAVCVIPDEALSYVSFESLLTAPAGAGAAFRDLPYAIRQRDWRYAYSATVLSQQLALHGRRQAQAAGDLVAMAPGFDQDVKAVAAGAARDSLFLHLLRQPWALELAGRLEKDRGAAAFTGRRATEASFDQQAKEAAVMYIGTHAFPDDRDPMQSELVFSKSADLGGPAAVDGYLHAYEIYRSPVRMRLLVLGGCETGIGRLRSGEGIVSLASGFAYAGCPSIVMSLWSIDDRQTASILGAFFGNLSRQQPIGAALTGAKRRYLQGAGSDDALYNPLYWSGLVSIGMDEPVPVPSPPALPASAGWWGLAAVAVLLGGLAFFIRRKRRLLPFGQQRSGGR